MWILFATSGLPWQKLPHGRIILYFLMSLNIKNAEVERLAGEVAYMAKETKTEAIRRALLERKARLAIRPQSESRKNRLLRVLERRIWPGVPAGVLGRAITKAEEEEILGFGPDGV